VHPDRGVEVGVGGAHDHGRGAPRREARDVDPPRIDRVVAHDLARDARDQRRLPLAPVLVALAEPVPALLHVRRSGLPGIDHQAGVFLGRLVHARARGEVVGRLGATVQHDDEGHGPAGAVAARHVELVGATSGLVAEGGGQELRSVRHGNPRRGRGQATRSAPRELKPALADLVEEAAQRLGHRGRHRASRTAQGPRAKAGAECWSGLRCGLGPHRFCRLGDSVDGRGFAPGLWVRAGWRHLAAEHALQSRSGFGEPAGIGEAGRLEQVSVQDVGHRHVHGFLCWGPGQASPFGTGIGFRRQWVGVGGLTLSARSGRARRRRVRQRACRAAGMVRSCGRPGRP
jgi:hypothetical protein